MVVPYLYLTLHLQENEKELTLSRSILDIRLLEIPFLKLPTVRERIRTSLSTLSTFDKLNHILFVKSLFLRLDIILDSPVVVLPRAGNSSEVFVAHLGKINVTNNDVDLSENNFNCIRHECYDIEIRDMNIFSLDTSSRRVPGPM